MSDNKKLLSENTIRRFMTLANVGTLSDNFIQENATEEEITEENEEEVNEEKEEKKKASKEDVESFLKGVKKSSQDLLSQSKAEREKMAKGVPMKESEEDLEEGGMYYARDDEDGEEEMDMDADLEMDEPADMDEPAGAADISLTEEEAQLLIDLGSRLGAAMGAADEPAMDEPAMDEPEMDLGAEEEEEDPMMQEDLVQEVLKRVTKRIISEKLKNK